MSPTDLSVDSSWLLGLKMVGIAFNSRLDIAWLELTGLDFKKSVARRQEVVQRDVSPGSVDTS